MIKIKHADIIQVRTLLLKAQKFRCAICDGDFKEAVLFKKKLKPKLISCLDHDHKTGVVRGVLCNMCNGADGKINNLIHRSSRNLTDEEWLDKLVQYRKLHSIPRTQWIHPTHKTEDEKRLARNAKARKKRALAKKTKE